MINKKINKLVLKAQRGDKEALRKLYDQFFNQIYYYVYSRINNVHEAQEVTSEVFLSMVEGIKNFKGESSFKNYIFAIAKNKIRDYIRNKYKTSDCILQSNLGDQFDRIIEDEYDNSYKLRLRRALQYIIKLLNPRYAKVLDLLYNQMNSTEEAARILGISHNNVKVIKHRAIRKAAEIWANLNVELKTKLLQKK